MEKLTLETKYYFGDGGDPSTPNTWIHVDFYPTNIVGDNSEVLKNYCFNGKNFEVLGRTAQEIIAENIDSAAVDILAALESTEFAGRFYYE